MDKVVVAMSGGVDSSVAAALLKEKGYQVTGITMKIWGGEALPEEGQRHACYGPGEEQDVEDAREVSRSLDIPFYEFDLRQEYKSEVLDYYTNEYLSGRTPNPCYRCNGRVKFGALMDKAREAGLEFNYFATGHYARIEHGTDGERHLLKKGCDQDKDQSYFISSLTQRQLGMAVFPLGDSNKEEVRRKATDLGLKVDGKPESQDFISGGYKMMIKDSTSGEILDMSGNKLGEHSGIHLYTIGQRKGLGVTGKEPLFVVDINAGENSVTVGPKEAIYGDRLVASGINWIALEKLTGPIKVKARIRNGHKEQEATVSPLSVSEVKVVFDRPQLAITPGQAVVFYQGDIVVGGGTIERTGE